MKIFADSASDLPIEYIEENDIVLLSLITILDDKQYDDLVEIKADKVYEMMKQGGYPKTSQVPLERFLYAFREAAAAGESGIYPALSSKLSGTYQAAVLALIQVKEEYPDFDLRIIDTKAASLGEGLSVITAVNMRDKGASLDDTEKEVRFVAAHTVCLFTVADLNYLSASGRLSKSSAVLGSFLNIQPLLEVVDGLIVPVEKVRGRKRVIKRLLERLDKEADAVENQIILICHSDDIETARSMKTIIDEKYRPHQIIINTIGSTISSHTGLGTIGLFFINKDKL